MAWSNAEPDWRALDVHAAAPIQSRRRESDLPSIPRGDGRISIRGGYGMFFEHGTGSEANTGSLVGSAPFNLTMTQLAPCRSDADALSMHWRHREPSDCSSGTGAYPIDVTSIPRKAIWPYVQQWSFGVQRELSHSLVLGMAYVGSKGTHLTAVRQPNAFPARHLRSLTVAFCSNGNPYGPHQPIVNNRKSSGAFDCANLRTLEQSGFQGQRRGHQQDPARIHQPAGRLRKLSTQQGLLPINAYRPYLGLQKIFSLAERCRFELSRVPGDIAPYPRPADRRHVVHLQPLDRRFLRPQ